MGHDKNQQKVDGYFLEMGEMAVEHLHAVPLPDLSTAERTYLAQYLGRLFDEFYHMGMRLGELKEQVRSPTNEPDQAQP